MLDSSRAALIVAALLLVSPIPQATAETGKVVGTVIDVRSEVAVAVHPVKLYQGNEVIAEALTDRLGKFQMEFTYAPDEPLRIRTASNTGHLPTEGTVDANTRLKIKVMPRWATIMGIVTDHQTERGLAGIPLHAARGDRLLPDEWATTQTDDIGVFIMKVPAFENDDVTKPIADLWLAINDGENENTDYAAVHTDTLPLWASSTTTKPTRLTVSLPKADVSGLTLEDVVSVELPQPLRQTQPPDSAKPEDEGPPGKTADTTDAGEATQAQPEEEAAKGEKGSEFIWVSPETGKKYRIIIIPVE